MRGHMRIITRNDLAVRLSHYIRRVAGEATADHVHLAAGLQQHAFGWPAPAPQTRCNVRRESGAVGPRRAQFSRQRVERLHHDVADAVAPVRRSDGSACNPNSNSLRVITAPPW